MQIKKLAPCAAFVEAPRFSQSSWLDVSVKLRNSECLEAPSREVLRLEVIKSLRKVEGESAPLRKKFTLSPETSRNCAVGILDVPFLGGFDLA